MIHVIHGDQEYLRSEALNKIKAALGDPDLVAVNTTELEGPSTSLDAIRDAASTVPFLAAKRLVIVHDYLSRLASGTDEQSKALIDYLPQTPDTTELVFIDGTTLDSRHPVLVALRELQRQGRANITLCATPAPREQAAWAQQWIRARAASLGKVISPEATVALADALGTDLRALASELDKLALYVGDRRRIELADVEALVSYTQAASIFRLTDAIAERRAATAYELLDRLRQEGAAAPYLITMIQRQFRILLQVAVLAARGSSNADIARRLKLRDFIVRRARDQARHWTRDQLLAAFLLLRDTDHAIKTGQMDEDTALDLLLADLLRRAVPSHARATTT
ncbi:MAG: DNA polymerase III subunit delta [Anaerolineae bacterium]